MHFGEAWETVLVELHTTLHRADSRTVEALCEKLRRARAVFVTGEGRSGLVARCFAMRLSHLGLRAHVVGGATAPPLGKDDILVAVSRTGETALTCTVARLAVDAGGAVAAMTADDDSALAKMSEIAVVLAPAAPSNQYGGSLFEQAALITLDAISLMLQERLGITREAMESRHANLE